MKKIIGLCFVVILSFGLKVFAYESLSFDQYTPELKQYIKQHNDLVVNSAKSAITSRNLMKKIEQEYLRKFNGTEKDLAQFHLLLSNDQVTKAIDLADTKNLYPSFGAPQRTSMLAICYAYDNGKNKLLQECLENYSNYYESYLDTSPWLVRDMITYYDYLERDTSFLIKKAKIVVQKDFSSLSDLEGLFHLIYYLDSIDDPSLKLNQGVDFAYYVASHPKSLTTFKKIYVTIPKNTRDMIAKLRLIGGWFSYDGLTQAKLATSYMPSAHTYSVLASSYVNICDQEGTINNNTKVKSLLNNSSASIKDGSFEESKKSYIKHLKDCSKNKTSYTNKIKSRDAEFKKILGIN